MNLRTLPDRILRKKASRVPKADEAARATLNDMAETMYINKGVGLAAVQVGIDKQLAVIDVGGGLVKMINPVIVKKEGSETQEEGCLSVPNTVVSVKRAKRIMVAYLDETGNVSQISAEGLFARAIQHEVDHLAGKLIVDYLSPIKRLLLTKRR